MPRSDVAHAPFLHSFPAPGNGSQDASWRAAAAWVLLGFIALLTGCARDASVQPALSERCLQLGGQRQDIAVAVPVFGTGLLHVAIRERGISVVASLADHAADSKSASPIDRLGTITLATDLSSGDAESSRVVSVDIASIDARDITADVCVSAEIIRPSGSPRARAQQSMAAADRATAQKQWQSASDHYLAAARLFDALGLRDEAAAARHAVAELEYGYMRRERDSIALATAVLSTSSARAPDIRAVRLALIAKALVQQADAGNSWVERADEIIRASARLFRSNKMGAREIPRLDILSGFLRYRRGRPGEASALFNRAAEECRILKDWECFARARQNLGALAEDRQNYSAALADYAEALRSLDPSRKPMLYADISDNLGRLQGRVGLIHSSEQSERTAMRLYAQLDDCDGARRAASTLGEMLVHIGSIGAASSYLNEATTLECRELTRSIAEESLTAPRGTAHSEASRQSFSWNLPDQERVCLHRPPFTDLTLQGDVAVFHALLAGSEIAQLGNQLTAAERCLELAQNFAATDVRSEIRLANARGQLFLRQHMPAVAGHAFEQALHLVDRAALLESSEYRGTALLGLADAALQTDDLVDARNDADAALWLSSGRADVSHLVEAIRIIAAIDRESGRRADAKQLLGSAKRLIEQVPTNELDPDTRAMYLATQHAVYAELTDLLASDSTRGESLPARSAWDAFAVADEGHARSLRYALDQSSLEHISARDGTATQDYRQLMRRIAALASGWATAAKRAELLEGIQKLSSSEPEDVGLDRTELGRMLRQMHATLIEYAAGRGSLFAFVVDEQRICVIKLGDLDAIDHAAGEFIARLRSAEPEPDRIGAAARRLAELVLWPVTPYVRQERLFLIPEDTLHTVPFAAMPWSRSNLRDLLIRHAEISVLPSALFLQRRPATIRHIPRSGQFVLVGDPVLRSTVWRRTCAEPDESLPLPQSSFDWMRSLPSLPGTRTEVLAVASLIRHAYPSASVLTLLGCAATPAALRANAPAADLLHVATHGLVDARRPRLSALVLTPDSTPPDDGAVQMLDILGMRLRAHLVVLSACDTSAGRLLPGEGVLGLAQVFLQSGAESVVASYWRVEDSATAGFMKTFYRHLLIDRLSVAAALRQAQLDEASPGEYSWAAFGLYGYPDSML